MATKFPLRKAASQTCWKNSSCDFARRIASFVALNAANILARRSSVWAALVELTGSNWEGRANIALSGNRAADIRKRPRTEIMPKGGDGSAHKLIDLRSYRAGSLCCCPVTLYRETENKVLRPFAWCRCIEDEPIDFVWHVGEHEPCRNGIKSEARFGDGSRRRSAISWIG